MDTLNINMKIIDRKNKNNLFSEKIFKADLPWELYDTIRFQIELLAEKFWVEEYKKEEKMNNDMGYSPSWTLNCKIENIKNIISLFKKVDINTVDNITKNDILDEDGLETYFDIYIL